MNKKLIKSLLSDSLIYGISGIISSFISIFLIPLYTKVFEPADYGVISILTTTTTLLNILLIFSLDNSAAVWFWDKPEEEERKVTFNSWIVFTGICGVGLMLLLVFLSTKLSVLFFRTNQYYILFILIGLNLIFVGFQKVVNIWCRMLQKPITAMVYSLIILITTVVLNIILVLYLHIGIKGVFVSQLASGFVGFIAMFILLGKWVQLSAFSKNRLTDMLRFSLPLVPATLLYWTMNMASVYFLRILLSDNAEIGLFQIGSSIANILSLCTWAFFQAWTPFALSIAKEENAKTTYSKILEWYCFFGFTSALLLLLFSKDILLIFTREAYLGAWKVIGLLAINVILLGVPNILSIANNIVKKNLSYAIAMAIGASLTVALFFILIPTYGKEGAAVSMILGNLVMCFFLGYQAQKIFYIPYKFFRIILFVAIATLMTFILLMLRYSMSEKLIVVIVILSIMAFLILKSFRSKIAMGKQTLV